MQMTRLFIAAAVLLAGMTAYAQAARFQPATCACTPADISQRAQLADKIFIGTVRSITEVEAMREPGREDPPVIVSIEVSEAFKNANSRSTELLHDSLTRVTCAGHDFKENTEYLIFAYERLAAKYEHWSLYDFKTGTFGVGGLCGGTKALSDEGAAADLAELRRLKASNDPVLAPKAKPEL